jgi:hypothetical protein
LDSALISRLLQGHGERLGPEQFAGSGRGDLAGVAICADAEESARARGSRSGWKGLIDVELHYNTAYHLHCEFVLRSGRKITLVALDQKMTYDGLLEGVPDARTNDWYLEFVRKEAARRSYRDLTPHLISPVRRDYCREPGDMAQLVADRPYRIPEWLPMVCCIGSFKDVNAARDLQKDLSVLTVVWFQDEFALPILEPALGQLRALDWEVLASDVYI